MTKDDLAQEIDYLLDMPRMKREGPAYKIVNTILGTIKAALLRGESVHINGFGTFKVKTYAAHSKPVHFFYKRGKKYGSFIHNVPVRHRVTFTPTRALKYFITQDLPNDN